MKKIVAALAAAVMVVAMVSMVFAPLPVVNSKRYRNVTFSIAERPLTRQLFFLSLKTIG